MGAHAIQPDAPIVIGPGPYTSWRDQPLGAITEDLEQTLIFDLMGDLAGRRVLDAGCGDGMLACAAAARGAEVTGVDPDPAMLTAARRRATDAGVSVTFLDGRIERLPFADASFDVVVAITVLCFVEDAAAVLRECARVLRPGGHLVLGELGRWNTWAALRRVRGWCGSPTWRAARFRSAAELSALAFQAGLSIAAIHGAVFYPPIALAARVFAPVDHWLGRLTTVGAAFIALKAQR